MDLAFEDLYGVGSGAEEGMLISPRSVFSLPVLLVLFVLPR